MIRDSRFRGISYPRRGTYSNGPIIFAPVKPNGRENGKGGEKTDVCE